MAKIDFTNLERYLEEHLKKVVRGQLRKNKQALIASIQSIIDRNLLASKEWKSLSDSGGTLRYHLGIKNNKSALTQIRDALSKSISKGISVDLGKHALTIKIFKRDFSEVLSLPGAQYTYSSKPKKLYGREYGGKQGGQITIPWLAWLLFGGSDIIVQDAFIKFDKAPAFSRTKNPIMVQNNRGRGWGIPQEFLPADEHDNWLIRVLNASEKEIVRAAVDAFTK